ncbi:MAG TPA: OB-fold nucleic acid binding domain-containing protein, partial [Pyrinomonadaceae bacterium]|nr:OB-fold nucleic acid binding domain-containing protein [Pyrinomonadaceae bacterium]
AWHRIRCAQRRATEVLALVDGLGVQAHDARMLPRREPLDEHRRSLEELGITEVADGELSAGRQVTLAGIVSGVQVRQSRKGNRFCSFRLDDRSGGVKCLVWSESYSRCSALIRDDEILVVEGRVESADGPDITVIAENARLLADAVPHAARSVVVTLPEDAADGRRIDRLLSLLSREQGQCDVYLDVPAGAGKIVTVHAEPLRIRGSGRLESELLSEGCKVTWKL